MVAKYRYWHEKLGMCEINWMEFTVDTVTHTANPFLLGGISTGEKTYKEHALNPKKIMQSTGLKDCKGKEIFEGDIIRYKHVTSDGQDFTYRNYEVSWDEAGAKFIVTVYGYDIPAEFLPNSTVIGNIHENKDLLDDN